jgi:hypothetical protein
MSSRPLLAVRLTLGPTQQLGATPKGSGVIFSIVGGSFEGPRLRGKVLPGGADWALLRPDGAMEIDVRITLESEDGALLYMTFQGIRHGPADVIAALTRGEQVDPARYYFRSVARFETAAPKYQFLNKILAIGSGEILNGKPIHTFEEVV